MKKRNFMATLAMVGILTTSTASAMIYSVIDLGSLSGSVTEPQAVNESGQVVGRSYDPVAGSWHPFLYDQGAMYELGPFPDGSNYTADAINDLGQILVSGQLSSGDVHSYLYEQGVITDLGLLPGGTRLYAKAINNSGQIAGFGNFPTAQFSVPVQQHAISYDQGVLSDLGTLGGEESNGYAINDAGQIAGGAENVNGSLHAVLYDQGTIEDLGLLPDWRYMRARAINNSGQLVGYGAMLTGPDHAFIYENGTLRDLGSLPGGEVAQAHAINDSGQIVGIAGTQQTVDGMHAFSYEQGNMYDLTDSVNASYPTVVMIDATDINNSGQIVGTALINRKTHAVLLTPDPLGLVTGADPDHDGVPASRDNCPNDPNPLQYDFDNDGIGLVCDNINDSDQDGITDDMDNCPDDPNPLQYDFDNDGIGLVCDNINDADQDGITDDMDNCPNDPNPLQYDFDNDGIGLVCDNINDSDGDGISDDMDNCPSDANPEQYDLDNDGIGLVCDGQTVDDQALVDRRLASEAREMDKRGRYIEKESQEMDRRSRYITNEVQEMDKRSRYIATEAQEMVRDGDGDGYSLNDGDCDDINPDIYPGAPETCGDGIDQDCDDVDEICSVEPTCDAVNPNLCTSAGDCTTAGGYWWSDNTCHQAEEGAPVGTVPLMPFYEKLQPFTSSTIGAVDVATDQYGRLYVADTAENSVMVFDATGSKVATLSDLSNPLCVAVDNDGRVYVGNKDSADVRVYGADYTFLHKLGLSNGDHEFLRPNDLAISSDGNIYVVDWDADMVKVYNPDGTFSSSFGSSGNGDGEFHRPLSVAIDEAASELIVLDQQLTLSHDKWIDGARIQIFDMNGVFKRGVTLFGKSIGNLFRPQRVIIDDQSRWYVTDAYHNVVFVYAGQDGTYLGAIYDMQNPLRTPIGITFGDNNRLYVAARGSGKVEMYQVDQALLVDQNISMVVSPLTASFDGQEIGANPAPQNITLQNSNEPILQSVPAESVSSEGITREGLPSSDSENDSGAFPWTLFKHLF